MAPATAIRGDATSCILLDFVIVASSPFETKTPFVLENGIKLNGRYRSNAVRSTSRAGDDRTYIVSRYIGIVQDIEIWRSRAKFLRTTEIFAFDTTSLVAESNEVHCYIL